MRRALVGSALCAAATYLTAPVVRRALIRRGSLDLPNHRSSHITPTPRGGGLACLVGVAVGVGVTGQRADLGARALVGIASLAAIGLADDQLGHLAPRTRLTVQALAGAAFAPTAALVPLTSFGTAAVVNVVNFMDGINGITGGTAAIWGLSTLMLGRDQRDAALQVLGGITAGAGLGFLPHNVPDARLFLGDVGSYLFGGLIAAGVASAADRPQLVWAVAAPLLPYGVDAAQAIVSRARRGEALTEAHRNHTYQRLVDHHRMPHTTVSALHAATAAVSGAVARSGHPVTAIGGPPVVAAAYVCLPWLLTRREEAR